MAKAVLIILGEDHELNEHGRLKPELVEEIIKNASVFPFIPRSKVEKHGAASIGKTYGYMIQEWLEPGSLPVWTKEEAENDPNCPFKLIEPLRH